MACKGVRSYLIVFHLVISPCQLPSLHRNVQFLKLFWNYYFLFDFHWLDVTLCCRYQTICYHNWVQSEPNEKARPFTNMIWKSSTKFGIGFASFKTKDNFNCSVVVARYSPSNEQNSDFSSNVNKGLFEPVSCQYVNNRDKPDFIEPDEKNCKVTKDHHGQMVNKDSSCTFNQLFEAFGASRRKGKLSFRVVL